MPEVRKGKRSSKSRLAHYMAIKGAAPKMPEVKYGRHLIEWLNDARTVEIGENGFKPLSFSELQAWATGTRTKATWWEISTMAKMSEAYATWSRKSTKADCESPIAEPETKSASEQIKDSFKSIDTKKLKRSKRG